MSLGVKHPSGGAGEARAPRQDNENNPHPSAPQTQPQPANNLPPLDSKFTGRKAELEEIRKLVEQNAIVGVNQQPAPHARGGLGKTSTALAFAWNHLAGFPGGVFFISGQIPLISQMTQLAPLVGVSPQPTQQATATAVCRKLTLGSPTLVLIDGVDDSATWNEMQQSGLLPQGKCRYLLTTRRQQLAQVKMFTIDRLSPEEAIDLLAAFRPDVRERENQHIATVFADAMDGLPFGLTLMGAYMLIRGDLTWMTFRDRLRQIGVGAVEEKRRGGVSVPDYAKYLQAMTDELIEAIPRQYRVALEYAALFPAENFMTKWLVALVKADDASPAAKVAGGDKKPAENAVSDLIFVQLLRSLSPKHKHVALHSLLRERLVKRRSQGDCEMVDSLENVHALAQRRGALVQAGFRKSGLREELSPLVRWLKLLVDQDQLQEAIAIANQIAPLLHALGREQEVIDALLPFTEESVVEQLSPDCAAVLLSNVGVSLAKAGQIVAARRNMESALQIAQRHLPLEHPTLAIRHSNLAGVLKSLGDLMKARRHIETAIRIEQKHLGADHPNLAIRHWWLGDIALSQGFRDEACVEYQTAYAIMAKHHPANHPQLQTLEKILAQASQAATPLEAS